MGIDMINTPAHYQPQPEDTVDIVEAKCSARTDSQWCYNDFLKDTLDDRSNWVSEAYKLRDALSDAIYLLKNFESDENDSKEITILKAAIEDTYELMGKYNGR